MLPRVSFVAQGVYISQSKRSEQMRAKRLRDSLNAMTESQPQTLREYVSKKYSLLPGSRRVDSLKSLPER